MPITFTYTHIQSVRAINVRPVRWTYFLSNMFPNPPPSLRLLSPRFLLLHLLLLFVRVSRRPFSLCFFAFVVAALIALIVRPEALNCVDNGRPCRLYLFQRCETRNRSVGLVVFEIGGFSRVSRSDWLAAMPCWGSFNSSCHALSPGFGFIKIGPAVFEILSRNDFSVISHLGWLAAMPCWGSFNSSCHALSSGLCFVKIGRAVFEILEKRCFLINFCYFVKPGLGKVPVKENQLRP